MTRSGFLIVATLLCPIIFCVSPSFAGDATRDDFDEKIRIIDIMFSNAVKGTILEDRLLLVVPQFTALASEGDARVGDCLRYLSQTTHTKQQRRIAIYAMHKLSLSKWVFFSNEMLNLYDRHAVSADEVSNVVIPIYSFSHFAMDNFLNRDVRKVLYRARAIAGLYETDKGYITSILTGEAFFFRWLSGPEPYK